MDFLWGFLKSLCVIMVVLLTAAYTVLLERKFCSALQGRVGPNRTRIPFLSDIPFLGPFLTQLGLFQPFADIGKLLFKEEVIPGHVHKFFYNLAPCLTFIPAYVAVVVIPFGVYNGSPMVLADIDLGAIFVMAMAGMGVYSLILAGYASRSKYPLLGSIRAAAQLISYEIAMVVSLLSVGLWAGSFQLSAIVQAQADSMWWIILQPITAFVYLICLFAETNRAPFDMPEAEGELAGGYNVEYGAFKFGMFFVGEYTNMIVGSAVFVCLFLGGWTLPFVHYPEGVWGAIASIIVFMVKVIMLLMLFVWVRWSFPRFRYDQVMKLGWGVLLPVAFVNLAFNAVMAYLKAPKI